MAPEPNHRDPGPSGGVDALMAEADVSALLGLAWTLAAVRDRGGDCRQALLDGAGALVEARAGFLVLMHRGRAPRLCAAAFTGQFRAERERFATLSARELAHEVEGLAPCHDDVAACLCNATGLPPPPHWRASSLRARVCGPLGLEQALACTRPTEGGGGVWIVLFRRAGEPLFGPRDRALLRLSLGMLNGPVWESVQRGEPSTVSERRREILALLLKGLAEKEIAAALGVSRHTVHHHIKALYREQGVTTRAALLARFIGTPADGGGGTSP